MLWNSYYVAAWLLFINGSYKLFINKYNGQLVQARPHNTLYFDSYTLMCFSLVLGCMPADEIAFVRMCPLGLQKSTI